ncbi:MAG: hypothetical protein QQW96_00745 [Tychonema bourrellyi B0820]|nr:hypothetical protein [Tychonema bourrellyi]MDQ2096165.1 hypothetical protein [Tychonema bourrellyi B0820]
MICHEKPYFSLLIPASIILGIGHRELGMGNWASGIGHRELGMGN